MNKKGVAVQTIILVLLGLVVLVFIAYWLYSLFAGQTPLSAEQCRTKLVTWCEMCGNNDWNAAILLSTDAVSLRCYNDYRTQFGLANIAAPDCSNMMANCGNLGIR